MIYDIYHAIFTRTQALYHSMLRAEHHNATLSIYSFLSIVRMNG